MSDPYYESRPQNSTTAIISLVAGILGLTFLPGIASIVAVIAGSMAEKEIRESGGRLEGENLARIGKILGWIGVALMGLGLCCALIFFVLVPLFAVAGSTTSGLLPLFAGLAV